MLSTFSWHHIHPWTTPTSTRKLMRGHNVSLQLLWYWWKESLVLSWQASQSKSTDDGPLEFSSRVLRSFSSSKRDFKISFCSKASHATAHSNAIQHGITAFVYLLCPCIRNTAVKYCRPYMIIKNMFTVFTPRFFATHFGKNAPRYHSIVVQHLCSVSLCFCRVKLNWNIATISAWRTKNDLHVSGSLPHCFYFVHKRSLRFWSRCNCLIRTLDVLLNSLKIWVPFRV